MRFVAFNSALPNTAHELTIMNCKMRDTGYLSESWFVGRMNKGACEDMITAAATGAGTYCVRQVCTFLITLSSPWRQSFFLALHFSNSFLRGSCTIICRSEGMCSHLPLAAVTAVPVAARSVAVSSLRIAIYPAPTWHVAHSVFNIHITYVVLPFFYQIYEIRASHCEERNDSKCPSSSFVFCFPPVLLLLSFPHLFCASHVLMCYYSYVIGFFKNFTLNHYCASSG